MPPLRPLTAPRCLAPSSRCLFSLGASSSTSHTTSQRNSPIQSHVRTQSRCLSSTPHPQRQTPSYLTVPAEKLPDYPYGPFRTYKQRNQGLFARSKIRFGNTVAEKYGRRSGTSWLPNRHTKRLWSQALGAFIRTRLTTQVLKTVDKLGGIDEYLLGSKAARIKELGPAGWALRWKIIQTPAIQARFARERAALGLPPKPQPQEPAEPDAVVDLGAHAGQPADGLKMTARAAHDMIDGMIAKDEEFVLGPQETPAEVRARDIAERAEKKAEQASVQVPEQNVEQKADANAQAVRDTETKDKVQ